MKTKAILVMAGITISLALASNAVALESSAGDIYAILPDELGGGGIGDQYFYDEVPRDYWVDLIVDLGSRQWVSEVNIDRWPGGAQNEKMRECFIYVGDESDPGFDPCDLASYNTATAIGHGHMYNDNVTFDFDVPVTASYVRYLYLRCQSHWMAGAHATLNRIINKDIDVTNAWAGVTVNAGILHGANGDDVSGDATLQNMWDRDPNDFWVHMVLDLGAGAEGQPVGATLTFTRVPGANNENMREAFIYVADESDPCFFPADIAHYDTQIGHGHMYNDLDGTHPLVIDLSAASGRYLYIRAQSHWMAGSFLGQDRMRNSSIDITSPLWGGTSIEVNAGILHAINGDDVSGGPTAQYLFDRDPNDFWVHTILDVDPCSGGQKLVDTLTFTRWGSTTNENMREAFVYVADEADPCFLASDSSFYDTQIGHGHMYNDTDGTHPLAIDLTNTVARYLYIRCQSHWMAGSFVGNDRVLNKSIDLTEGPPEFADCNDVRDKGKVLTGDLNQDCYVDTGDLLIIVIDWLGCTLPTDADCVIVRKRPTYAIVKDPCVVVDGFLDDWVDAEWIALSDVYFGEPLDIGNQLNDAKFALKWDDGTDKVYAAVVVEDACHVFESSPTNWDSSDRIEVYAQGDPNGGEDYGAQGSNKFDIAQQYAVGFGGLIQGDSWAVFGDGTYIPEALEPGDAEFEHRTRTSGSTITYEIGAKMFIFYGGHWLGIDSEVRQLQAGIDVGFDVIADTRHGTGFGMRSENLFTQKYRDAGQFQLYELIEGELPPLTNCGDWGFLTADMDMNCEVNLGDVLELSKDWLKCNDPLYVDGGPCVASW